MTSQSLIINKHLESAARAEQARAERADQARRAIASLEASIAALSPE